MLNVYSYYTCNHYYIPTNLSKTKSGTKFLKKRDFWSKIRTFLKNPMKMAKFIKLIGLTVYKNAVKNAGQSKEKSGQR